jgi:hypothetical protein
VPSLTVFLAIYGDHILAAHMHGHGLVLVFMHMRGSLLLPEAERLHQELAAHKQSPSLTRAAPRHIANVSGGLV